MKLPFLNNDDQNILFPILAIAFLLRLVFIIETTGTPFVENLFSDSEIYSSFAAHIIENNNWIGDEPFFMAPVYPYTIAIFKLFFGDGTLVLRLFQVMMSCIAIVFIYLAGRNYFNKSIAITSAIIAAIFDSYVFYSGIIFSESLQILAVSILLFYLSRKDRYSIPKHWLYTGIIFGITALFRANILVFLPVFLLLVMIKKGFYKGVTKPLTKVFGMFLIGTLLSILPVTIINFVASGEVILLTTNGGINFHIGNNTDAVGVFITPDEFNYESDMSGKFYAERILGVELTSAEASSFWYKKTFEDIFNQPINFATLFAKKIFLFFDSEEFPQSSILNKNFYEDNYSNTLKLPLLNYGILSLLFIFGMVVYLKKEKIDLLLLAFFLSYLVATALFFVNLRFRLGITPLMIIIAAYGLQNLFESFSSQKFKQFLLPGITVLSFLVLSNFVVSKPNYTDYDAYLHLGDIAQEKNNYEKAIYYYNRSIVLADNYQTFMNLGNTFAKKRDYRNAISAFAEAEKRNTNDHLLFFNRGIVYAQIGDYQKAIDEYNKALKLRPDFSAAVRNTGIIHFVTENYEEAKYYFNKFLKMSDDQQTNALVRQDLETIERKLRGN